jgi:hypothetical protein
MDQNIIESSSPSSLSSSLSSLSSPPSSIFGFNNNVGENIGTSSNGSNESNWFWTFGRYFLIILILSFLGFNLLAYLGKITGSISDLFKPVMTFFGYGVGETVKTTVNIAATGTKGLADVAAGTVNSGINVLEQGLSSNRQYQNQNQNQNQRQSDTDAAILNKVVLPMPDEAGSRTQQSKGGKSKAGYCYIGEDRGFRSCIQVGEADMCMSGDIFPTQDVCINPSLRN